MKIPRSARVRIWNWIKPNSIIITGFCIWLFGARLFLNLVCIFACSLPLFAECALQLNDIWASVAAKIIVEINFLEVLAQIQTDGEEKNQAIKKEKKEINKRRSAKNDHFDSETCAIWLRFLVLSEIERWIDKQRERERE